MKDVIIVDNLCKRFKRYQTRGYTTLKDLVVKRQLFKMRQGRQYVEALRNVTFSVSTGTVLGIIGPNGSGKSTLLKVIAGIYRPNSGKVSVTGRMSALLGLGVGFHPDLNGRENIMIGGLCLGLSRGQVTQAFDDIVHFAELEDFIDAPVRTYSSGMYARLAFSIAVHVDPDILLLDEVLAVGDAHFAQKSRARMDEFKRQGKTILLVTHELSTIEQWCHQALWLDNGEVCGWGDPREVIGRYRAKVLVSATK
jgi:lipopolysaccharide transport system ATP-binding protein